jgi:hypothetical protein
VREVAKAPLIASFAPRADSAGSAGKVRAAGLGGAFAAPGPKASAKAETSALAARKSV